MSDQVAVDVVTRYRLDGNLDRALAQVDAVGRAMTQSISAVEAKVKGVEGTLQKFGAAFAGYLGIEKILQAKDAIFHSLGAFEQMRLGIGGTLAATGAAKFADSIDIAKHRLNELYQIAGRQVGTFEQYAGAFEAIMAPVRIAGGTSTDARDLVAKLLPVFHAMGGNAAMNDAGYGIARVLTMGVQGMHTPPTVRRMLASMSISDEKFNSASAQQRIQILLTGAAKFEEMVKAGENTMDAQTTTLSSNFQALGRVLGQDLFEQTKRSLREINGWIEKNHDTLERTARIAGTGIASTVKHGGEFAKVLAPLAGLAGGAFAVSKVAAGLGGVGTFLGGMIGNGALAAQLGMTGGSALQAALGLSKFALGLGGAIGAIGLLTYAAYKVGEAIADMRLAKIQETADTSANEALVRSGRSRLEQKLGGGAGVERALGELARTGDINTKSARELRQYAAVGGFSKGELGGRDGAERLFELLHKDREKRMPKAPEIKMSVVIRQDFRDVADPDRIASLTAQALKKIAMAATQSRRAMPVGA